MTRIIIKIKLWVASRKFKRILYKKYKPNILNKITRRKKRGGAFLLI